MPFNSMKVERFLLTYETLRLDMKVIDSTNNSAVVLRDQKASRDQKSGTKKLGSVRSAFFGSEKKAMKSFYFFSFAIVCRIKSYTRCVS